MEYLWQVKDYDGVIYDVALMEDKGGKYYQCFLDGVNQGIVGRYNYNDNPNNWVHRARIEK